MNKVIAGLVLLLVFATGCTHGEAAPTTPPPPTMTTGSATTPPSSTSVRPEEERKAGEAYLVSAERVAAYTNQGPVASKVAQAILDDKFGPYSVYEPAKQATFSGWGSMHTINGEAYAMVWWSGGKPDASKAKGFSLYGVQIETGLGDGVIHVSYPRDGYIGVVDAVYMGVTRRQLDPFRHPTSVEMAKRFDKEALDLLEASLKKAGL